MADKRAAIEAATMDRAEYVKDLVRRSIMVKERLIAEYTPIVVSMADICIESLVGGGKLLLCGNGGSAADAQHLAAELLVRLRPDVNRDGVPAIALATDMSSITACGNDYSYEVLSSGLADLSQLHTYAVADYPCANPIALTHHPNGVRFTSG